MSEPKHEKNYAGAVGALLLAAIGFGALVVGAEVFPDSLSAEGQLARFAGALHPVTVHLPIGFFAALFLLETLTLLRVTPRQGRAEGLLLFGGVAAAMVASLLGICLASGGDYTGDTLTGHRRMGLAFAFAGIVLGFLKIRVWDKGGFFAGLIYWVGLVVAMGILGIAGHLGGSITHGEHWLSRDMPAPLARLSDDAMARVPGWLVTYVLGHPKPQEVAVAVAAAPALAEDGGETTQQPQTAVAALPGTLESQAIQVLESRCSGCHGEKKKKGKLRLDSLQAAARGGKSGSPAIVGGDPMGSELVARITLPPDHEDVMPPEGKKSLTAAEILLLIHWIEAGAPWGGERATAEPTASADALPSEELAPESPATDVPAQPARVARGGPVELPPELVAALDALSGAGAIAMPLGQDTTDVGVDWSLARESVTDATLALLAPLGTHLRQLDLTGTAITDEGLAHLAGLTSLRKLHLARTEIDGAGLGQLASLAELEVLNLYATRVTTGSLTALTGLGKLQRLYLFETAVDPETDAENIARMLPGVDVDHGWTLEEIVVEAAAADQAKPSPQEIIASLGLADFFDEGGCCANAHAAGQACDHPCCVAALEAKEVCAKCNADGAASYAERQAEQEDEEK